MFTIKNYLIKFILSSGLYVPMINEQTDKRYKLKIYLLSEKGSLTIFLCNVSPA